MNGDGSRFAFAMVLDVNPPERAAAFAQTVRGARPEKDLTVDVRTPALYLFTVSAPMEFLAIDRAQAWLHTLAAAAKPPVTLVLNAQPEHEV